ncbi:MAG: hypothetical protein ABL933_18325 [Methyloglobulus sp.]|nr:hypothetical protein [Methyloglobulus sp.]
MKEQLQNLNMGDFSDDEVTQIETLLAAINPKQINHSFGFRQGDTFDQNFEDLAGFLEESLADRLATLITELLKCLSDADPVKMSRQPNWLEKVTGKYLEISLDYLEARLRIDGLLKEAEAAAQQLEVLFVEVDKQGRYLRTEIRDLRVHIAAGRLYMARSIRLPESNTEPDAFDKPQERFARRITNLAALLASHEMTTVQLDMAYAHMADLLANYYESCHVLLPIWREHSLGLALNGGNHPMQVNLARQAHLRLTNKLSEIA